MRFHTYANDSVSATEDRICTAVLFVHGRLLCGGMQLFRRITSFAASYGSTLAYSTSNMGRQTPCNNCPKSIMVWRMFLFHFLGTLNVVDCTKDQFKYAAILPDHIHPHMRIVFHQHDDIFQKDNVIQLTVYAHGLKSTRMCLPYFPGPQIPRT